MSQIILVQVEEEETAVAVLENGKLVEIYFERPLHERMVGNIYKGRVENVLPGMQAAFVDIGLEKNAFLYVEDILPAAVADWELPGEKISSRPISELLRPGQGILVQISKEPIGTKGARATTHISLPGRYVVLMPTVDYVGVSRRISSEGERDRLRAMAKEIKPKGMGLIVRTAAEGASEEELVQDIKELTKVWRGIERRSRRQRGPALVHRELDLLERILRDLFSDQVEALVTNSRDAYERATEIMDRLDSRLRERIKLREGQDLFAHWEVPSQIDQALRRKVWLKCGGYIVIDQAEALTSIDVNTGKYVGGRNLEDTVVKTNLEAAAEIARQLRLRNIGGIIIIDFIDMEDPAHQEQVLKALEEELRKDKTRATVLGMTRLGLVEVTRKKARGALESVLLTECPYCGGRGKVLSQETVGLAVRKEILYRAEITEAPGLIVRANPAVAAQLIGSGGVSVRLLEQRTGKTIIIKGEEHRHMENFVVQEVFDAEELGQGRDRSTAATSG
ncbi:MAG: Rne/Rng family ribonuclease [Clostridia bacterium]|nr:Rne/Rng family ribonuclease [Clostridia bacterium]